MKRITLLTVLLLFAIVSFSDSKITRGPNVGEIYFIGPTHTGLGLYYSTDFGQTAICVDSTFTSSIMSICADKTEGVVYYVTMQTSFYHSDDYGQAGSWELRNSGIKIYINSGRNEGEISIIGIILFQLYWVNKSFDLVERQFNQSVEIALYNVAEKVMAFNGHELPNENPVRQISSNYFIVDINDVIDASILDHYLKTEFDFRNLSLDYEYAIYDCDTDKMVFGNYINPAEKEPDNSRKFQKYDEFTYYFGIIFPSKALYILNSMNIWIISSFVLITAIVFFAYAIFIIFRQRRLSEIQKDFINNMTHEFKTPVSTIGISANVLSDPNIINDPERLKNYAGIIANQNIRLEQQVEKVLQLARIETNKFNFDLENIDLNKLITEVAGSFRFTINEKEGNLALELKADRSVIYADKLHLANVIYNLVDNGIKYCTGRPEIKITTVISDNKTLLSISDNGIGIAKQYQKKIFEKFYRIPTGDVHNVKGFGIGLNYVMNIIKKMKWRIKITSFPGQGSTFTIIIPK